MADTGSGTSKDGGAVELVRERVDIVDLVSETVPLRKRGRAFVANCPFHTEKTPSFHVNPERQSWRCFGACGEGGDIFSFVMKRDGVEFREALRTLAERAGIDLSAFGTGTSESREAYERLLAANEAAIVFFRQALLSSAAGAEARTYVERRGLDAKTVEVFELGFAPDGWDNLRAYLIGKDFSEQELLDAGLLTKGEQSGAYDRFRRRLIFPIRDDRGRAVGFGGRALDDAKPKYLNTPQTALFDKSHLLFALDRAKEQVRRAGEVVIVEGYLDAIAAHQFGYTNVVASLGTALTEHHIHLLRRLTRRVTLCMDADPAGLDAAIRGEEVARSTAKSAGTGEAETMVAWDGLVRAQARAPVEVRVFTVPSGKDPDEAIRETPDGWPEWVAAAMPPFDFRLQIEASRTDLNDPRARVELADRMVPLLLQIGDAALQASYLSRLAQLARVPETALMVRLRELTPRKELGQRLPLRRTVKAEQQNLAGGQDSADQPARRRGDDPVEAFALALVVRHPALRQLGRDLDPRLFQQSDYRELFERWLEAQELSEETVAEELRPALAAGYAVPLPPLDGPSAEKALVDAALKLELRLLTDQKRLLTAALLEAQNEQSERNLQPEVLWALESLAPEATTLNTDRDGDGSADPARALLALRWRDHELARQAVQLRNELRLHRGAPAEDPA